MITQHMPEITELRHKVELTTVYSKTRKVVCDAYLYE